MGHRLSKSVFGSSVGTHQQQKSKRGSSQEQDQNENLSSSNQQNLTRSSFEVSDTSVQPSAIVTPGQNLRLESATLTVPAQITTVPRRFIIKIQLTKMEAGSGPVVGDTTVAVDSNGTSVCGGSGNSVMANNLDNNLNVTKPVLNLTFTKNIPCDASTVGQHHQQHQIVIDSNNETIQLNNLNSSLMATTGTISNEFISNFAVLGPSSSPRLDEQGNSLAGHIENLNISNPGLTFNNMNSPSSTNSSQCISNCSHSSNVSNLNCLNNNNSIPSQLHNENNVSDINQRIQDSGQTFSGTMCSGDDEKSHCCRRKKSSAYPSKWRCCKCSCRDSAKLSNVATASTSGISRKSNQEPAVASTSKTSSKGSWTSKLNCAKKDSTSDSKRDVQSPAPSTSSAESPSSSVSSQWPSSEIPNLTPTQVTVSGGAGSDQHLQKIGISFPPAQLNRTCPRLDHLTMWEPILPLTPFIDHHHHIQTIACPGGPHNLFVFSVNHPSQQPSQVVFGQIEDLDERARRLRALEIEAGIEPLPSELETALANVLSPQNPWHHIMCSPSSFGTVVHSQVDYIHCLVPDLEKITSSSFYWGKMDRYEAERLLEGKPEGTFLLRDSAQEEYLFSVTFRKYGRSLHARIEQFNHKFSFDGHDPGVFTASTVTGLLEHYKDPSCVMFFEPMLTIPLHRNFTFSLQQLCRATIVSHITYDGINELHLPNSLKGYLKEYHYKLRVRVKPFDEPFYTCS